VRAGASPNSWSDAPAVVSGLWWGASLVDPVRLHGGPANVEPLAPRSARLASHLDPAAARGRRAWLAHARSPDSGRVRLPAVSSASFRWSSFGCHVGGHAGSNPTGGMSQRMRGCTTQATFPWRVFSRKPGLVLASTVPGRGRQGRRERLSRASTSGPARHSQPCRGLRALSQSARGRLPRRSARPNSSARNSAIPSPA
jgi:hypothetical protein